MDTLEQKLQQIPENPGIYRMLDQSGQVIYVGKAKHLRRRVQSYFRTNVDSPKTALLVSLIHDLDWIVTENEREALLLEANLIKKHKPRFNIRLRDAKKYPYLCITVGEDFPRIFKTRRQTDRQARYFGPYPSVATVRHTIKLLHRLFPIRYCKRRLVDGETKGSACFYFHINRCPAPCEARISSREYKKYIDSALLFLEGKHKKLVRRLTKQMQEHSARLEFEQAAIIRDQLEALGQATEFQAVHQAQSDPSTKSLDIMVLQENLGVAAFIVLQIRDSRLLSQKLYLDHESSEKPELFSQFFRAYLGSQTADTADTVLVPDTVTLEELSGPGSDTLRIIHPADPICTPAMKKLLAHARRNAEMSLDDEIRVQLYEKGLLQLQKVLQLPGIPRRIEGFDIANLGGEANVAGMVSFANGHPDKKQYRHFSIKSFAGQDDFASMREAVARRYQRLLNENKALPDLILIDGGRGQLNAALESLRALGLSGQPVAGLAKKEELLFLPEQPEPLRLDRHGFALRILQQVRDESHRFVNTFHARKRSSKRHRSRLEDIPGIGSQTRRSLLKKLGSLEAVSRASLETLEKITGSKKRARTIHEHFHPGPAPKSDATSED